MCVSGSPSLQHIHGTCKLISNFYVSFLSKGRPCSLFATFLSFFYLFADLYHVCHVPIFYYPGQKKRTIVEIRGEKNAVPRVISCSIRRDQSTARVADSRGLDLPCADRAWYHTWNSVLVAANLDDGSFFFLSRVVQVLRPHSLNIFLPDFPTFLDLFHAISSTDWCSEIASLTSLDACDSGASTDRRKPISLHQAVL